jgi:hydroxyethylthiazole kinase-like uncharacterized protein yjeF
LPEIEPRLGKEGRGSVLTVGGSVQNPGAILLAAVAALRAGAGKLQIATAHSVAAHLAVSVPEARVIGLPERRSGELGRGCSRVLRSELDRCDALLVGPGMMEDTAAVDVVKGCARARGDRTVVLDAIALHVLRAGGEAASGSIVATPHAGEMAELLGCERDDVLAAPCEVAREAARRFGVVVALKGAETYVVAPDGTAFRNTAGNLGLGTSGSGDALSGVIAGLAARGADPLQAAVWGVYVHARAGDVLAAKMGPLGFLARELLGEVPALLSATK